MLYNFLISQGAVHLRRLGPESSPEPSGGSQTLAPTCGPLCPRGTGGRAAQADMGKRGPWEGRLPASGGGGGAATKIKGRQPSGAGGPPGPSCLPPLVTHPERRRSLRVPARCGACCRAGAASSRTAQPHRVHPTPRARTSLRRLPGKPTAALPRRFK